MEVFWHWTPVKILSIKKNFLRIFPLSTRINLDLSANNYIWNSLRCIMPDRLSLPPSFSKSAEKLGWSALNYKIQANSIQLIQDDFRITFWLDEEEGTKMWDLHKYSVDNGWHLVHRMFHPGTSRLDWVLKTSHQIMKIISGEPKTSGTSAKTTKTTKRGRSKA